MVAIAPKPEIIYVPQDPELPSGVTGMPEIPMWQTLADQNPIPQSPTVVSTNNQPTHKEVTAFAKWQEDCRARKAWINNKWNEYQTALAYRKSELGRIEALLTEKVSLTKKEWEDAKAYPVPARP